MVQIPVSQGVRARPTTQVGDAAPSIAQTQILPNAISRLGGDIAAAGFVTQRQNLKEQQEVQRAQLKEQEDFKAAQLVEYKNNLRRFDNEQKVRLDELPASPQVIGSEKKSILEKRKIFSERLSRDLGADNDDLRKLFTREFSTSSVGVEFDIDKRLSSKKKTFGTNKIFESISDLKEQFEAAESPEEFRGISNALSETLAVGLNAGYINQKDIIRQEEAFKKIRKEKEANILRQQAFSDVIRGSLLLDASNKDHKALVDSNFEELSLMTDNPNEVAEEISVRTGIIPKQAKSFWSSSLMNGTNAQKIDAANTITDVINDNPSLEAQFSAREKALATAISSRQALGISEENVVKFAEEEIKQNKSQDFIVRQGQFNIEAGATESSKKAIDMIEDIQSELKDESGFLFFEAEVPEAMALSVRRLAKDFYLNEGLPLDDALEAAKTKIKGEWAITNVGVKRYQRFAPERFYGQEGIDNKWIESQAIQMVRKATIEPMPDIKENIQLEVIPDTVGTGKPSYHILRKNQFGALDYVRGQDNLNLVFNPDITKSKEYKEGQERIEQLKLTPEKAEDFEGKQKRIFKRRSALRKNLETAGKKDLRRFGIR